MARLVGPSLSEKKEPILFSRNVLLNLEFKPKKNKNMYYSRTTDFTETPEFWIMAIINLILFVVFLRMAWNIAQLRKGLVTTSAARNKQIRKLEFKGRSEEVLDLYYDELFEVYCESEDTAGEKTKKYKRLVALIENLNGEIPEEITEYLKKYQ